MPDYDIDPAEQAAELERMGASEDDIRAAVEELEGRR
jgi:hypothetical protein